MNCRTVRSKILAELDQLAPGKERDAVDEHLRVCRSCSQESAERERIRAAMRALPRMAPPPDLTVRLHVLASRERQRRSAGWLRRLATSLHLAFDGLMRPMAVPLAGGVFSALILFASLVPSFAWVPSAQDVPTALSTEAAVKGITAPIGFGDGEAVVDVTIDDQGHMVDFDIVRDTGEVNQDFRRSVENALLFTVFTPRTAFGQPVGGKLRVTFRNSSVEVKG